MKSLLVLACLGALLSWGAAYPVIRLERMPVARGFVTIPMAMRLCGWDARCLLSQDIVGMQDEEVQRTYAAVVQLAILRELSGYGEDDLSDEAPQLPADSSEEAPQVADPASSPSDSEQGAPPAHQIHVMNVHHPLLGTRRIIIIRHAVRVADSDEDPHTTADESRPDIPDIPDIPEMPDNSDDPKPGNELSGRDPEPLPDEAEAEATTELANAIEPEPAAPSTEAAPEDRRESLGDSNEAAGDVEVFDPKKPARIAGEDRFRYKTEVPEIRQI